MSLVGSELLSFSSLLENGQFLIETWQYQLWSIYYDFTFCVRTTTTAAATSAVEWPVANDLFAQIISRQGWEVEKAHGRLQCAEDGPQHRWMMASSGWHYDMTAVCWCPQHYHKTIALTMLGVCLSVSLPIVGIDWSQRRQRQLLVVGTIITSCHVCCWSKQRHTAFLSKNSKHTLLMPLKMFQGTNLKLKMPSAKENGNTASQQSKNRKEIGKKETSKHQNIVDAH